MARRPEVVGVVEAEVGGRRLDDDRLEHLPQSRGGLVSSSVPSPFISVLDDRHRQLEEGIEGGEEAVLLVAEEVVEGAPRDAGELEQVADRGRGVALVGDRGDHRPVEALELVPRPLLTRWLRAGPQHPLAEPVDLPPGGPLGVDPPPSALAVCSPRAPRPSAPQSRAGETRCQSRYRRCRSTPSSTRGTREFEQKYFQCPAVRCRQISRDLQGKTRPNRARTRLFRYRFLTDESECVLIPPVCEPRCFSPWGPAQGAAMGGGNRTGKGLEPDRLWAGGLVACLRGERQGQR